MFALRRRWGWGRPGWGRLLRRFRHPLPAAFAVLALLVLIGGAIYPPTNYTGLNYHLARVLQWLAHGQWCWIHTANTRMNFSGCAFEWLTTPLVLFTQSDRALFLVNFIPLLLLPGLIFSAFTRLGVRARAAWHWMWLLPTGYNFLLQAGSIDNDFFATVFALAAIDFGCRAWASRRLRDLWTSALAVALLTGTKPTNLPLLLPWLILVLPLFSMVRRHWLSTLCVTALGLVASFLPIALMNVVYSRDWLGRSVLAMNLEVHRPLVGLAGNAFQLLLDNFTPTVFPLAAWWNQHVPLWAPPSVMAAFNDNFDPCFFLLGEVPTEDWAGLGFGLCVLLVASVVGSLRWRRDPRPVLASNLMPPWLRRGVMLAAWISLLAYSMKSGMATAARLIAPYYLLLLPLLLTGAGQSQIVRATWWRVLAGGALGLALVAVALSPDRPLWPAKTILSQVLAQHPGQHLAARAFQVYDVYSHRNDALAGVRALLPPGLKVVGFLGHGDDCDISLWRPFGSRRVEHFLLTDSPEFIRARAQYVVVGGGNLDWKHVRLDDWLRRNGAELVATTNAVIKATGESQFWYVTRLKP